MNVRTAYRALNAEQQRIVTTKMLDAKKTPDELLQLLVPIAAYDAAINTRLKSGSTGCLVALGGLTALTSLILGSGNWTLPWVAAFVAGTVVCVGTLMLWISGRKADLSDNFSQILIPLLKLLRDDVARGETVDLHLDMRLATDKAKKTGVSAPYKRGAYYKIVDTIYEDPWMTAKARLNDGSLLGLRITDSIRLISRTKRGSSGKIRTNSREKKRSRVQVQLAVRKNGHAVKAPKDARVKSTDKRHVISLSRNFKMRDLSPVPPMKIIDTIADAYGSVRRVPKEARAQ